MRIPPQGGTTTRSTAGIIGCLGVIVAALGPLGGCASPESEGLEQPTAPSFVGEFVEAGREPGVSICGGSFEYLDRFVGAYVGASSAPSLARPVRYHVIGEASLRGDSPCSATSVACAAYGVVYSSSPVHLHETVHAIREIQHGDPPPGMAFFEEGIAQLHLGFTNGWDDAFVLGDAAAYVDSYPPGDLYDRSGHFLSFLAQDGRSTPEAFVDRTADVDGPGSFASVVADALGVELDLLQTDYAAYPRCSSLAWAQLPVECGAASIDWSDDGAGLPPHTELRIDGFGCAHPRAVGPLRGTIWTSVSFDVAEAGFYEVRRDGSDAVAVGLVACDLGCGADVDLRLAAPQTSAVVELPPARYVVRVTSDEESVADVSVRITGPL